MASSIIKRAHDFSGAPYRGTLASLTDGGVYEVSTDYTTDMPSDLASGTIGNLLVIQTLLIHQVLFIGNASIYVRRYIGSWSEWKKVTLSAIS